MQRFNFLERTISHFAICLLCGYTTGLARSTPGVFCTDALYQRLFEIAGLRLLDVQSPLASGWATIRCDAISWKISPCEPAGRLKARRGLEPVGSRNIA